MAASFSITTTTNAIVLDGEGRALVLFTVSNQTGRSVRVRTDVSPFPPTPADWFSIEGETARLYPPGGAEAVSVQVAAVMAQPGPYAFRLDAVSTDKPDEEWAHGPVVGFEITTPPPPPPPDEHAGYVETLVGALAGALVAGILSTIAGVIMLAVLANGSLAALVFFMRLYLPGALSVGCAFGGALGVVVALSVRDIPESPSWRSGLAFAGLAMVGLTIVQAAVFKALPLFAGNESFVVMVIATLVVVALLALAARAVARYTSGGKL